MITEFKDAKEFDGMAINRVISNVKEGMCQVCCLPLADFDTFIVKCCGLIVCDVCGIKGNNISFRYSRKHKMNTLIGSCANCKADVDIRSDLIFLDKNFDVETLLSAKGNEISPICEVSEATTTDQSTADVAATIDQSADDNTEKSGAIKNPKLEALLAICKGREPEKKESVRVDVPHLLKGVVNIPPIDGSPRKVLVFANHNETLNIVEDFLVTYGVDFMRLGGSFREKADTVEKFRTYGTVLLINSQQNCAGINLEFCSDIVFYHKIQDVNISSQVVGRGQRLGRTCNLRLHYLCYKNEKAIDG
jgi:SNF2 family DNA or RNA helicase